MQGVDRKRELIDTVHMFLFGPSGSSHFREKTSGQKLLSKFNNLTNFYFQFRNTYTHLIDPEEDLRCLKLISKDLCLFHKLSLTHRSLEDLKKARTLLNTSSVFGVRSGIKKTKKNLFFHRPE